MSTLSSRGVTLVALLGLAGCGGGSKTLGGQDEFEPKQVQCTIDGEQELRMTRDCSTELSYQERRIGTKLEILGQKLGGETDVQFRPVKSSLTMLLEQQRSLCRDWNSCALARKEYVERSGWLTSQFSTLSQLLDSADPSTMKDDESRERLVQSVLEWAERAQRNRLDEKVAAAEIEVDAARVEQQERGNEIRSERAEAEQDHAGAVQDRAGASVRRAGATQLEAGATEQHAGALEQQAETVEERARLRREAAERAARLRERASQAQGESQARMHASLTATIQQHEGNVESIEKVEALVGKLKQQDAGLTDGRRPPMCTSGLLEDLKKAGRASGPASGRARALAGQVERICERFDDWDDPPADIRRKLRDIDRTLDRAEEMASDFGVSSNEPRAVAEKVLASIRVARRELKGVETGDKRFPCMSDNWKKLRDLTTKGNQWAGAAARRVLRLQDRVCGRMGVSPSGLRRAQDNLESSIERAEDGLRTQKRQYRDIIEQTRSYLPESG